MADELEPSVPNEVVDTPEVTSADLPESTPQYTDIEQQAIDQGWRPKEEWEGDESKWRGAKEFVERGELYGKIDHMGRELKDTKKALKMLQEHHTKVKEVEFKKAVEELKALQKRHLEEGNSDGYIDATEILTDLKAEQKAREVVREVTPNQPDPRFVQWTEANKWYTQDTEMRRYADIIGQGYAGQNPDTDPVDVLKYVTAEVKSKFKDKFTNLNRIKANSVEGASNGNSAANKSTFELSDEERKIMNTFVRTGAMTKEEYIAEVKSMRGAK
jgi:hypothetical protein